MLERRAGAQDKLEEYVMFFTRSLPPECQECWIISQYVVASSAAVFEASVAVGRRGKIRQIDSNREEETLLAEQGKILQIAGACNGPTLADRDPGDVEATLSAAGYDASTPHDELPVYLQPYAIPLEEQCGLPESY